MGKKAGGKDFAPRVRSMFDRALEKLELKGDADKLMEQALTDDFMGTVQKMASYAPKQVDMTLDQQVTIDTTQLTREVIESLYQLEEPNGSNEGTTPAVH